MPVKLCKIDVGKDVGIVHQERFVAVQKRTRFLYPAACVEHTLHPSFLMP